MGFNRMLLRLMNANWQEIIPHGSIYDWHIDWGFPSRSLDVGQLASYTLTIDCDGSHGLKIGDSAIVNRPVGVNGLYPDDPSESGGSRMEQVVYLTEVKKVNDSKYRLTFSDASYRLTKLVDWSKFKNLSLPATAQEVADIIASECGCTAAFSNVQIVSLPKHMDGITYGELAKELARVSGYNIIISGDAAIQCVPQGAGVDVSKMRNEPAASFTDLVISDEKMPLVTSVRVGEDDWAGAWYPSKIDGNIVFQWPSAMIPSNLQAMYTFQTMPTGAFSGKYYHVASGRMRYDMSFDWRLGYQRVNGIEPGRSMMYQDKLMLVCHISVDPSGCSFYTFDEAEASGDQLSALRYSVNKNTEAIAEADEYIEKIKTVIDVGTGSDHKGVSIGKAGQVASAGKLEVGYDAEFDGKLEVAMGANFGGTISASNLHANFKMLSFSSGQKTKVVLDSGTGNITIMGLVFSNDGNNTPRISAFASYGTTEFAKTNISGNLTIEKGSDQKISISVGGWHAGFLVLYCTNFVNMTYA